MKNKTISPLLVLLAMMLPSAAFAIDTVGFTLTLPVQTATLGSTVSFTATVSAPITNANNVFLNGDAANLDAPLTLDDSGFFLNFPFFLTPGQSFTGILFTVTVPLSATPGTSYNGVFGLLGGLDGGSLNALGTVNFKINAQAGRVPEGGPILYLFLIAVVTLIGFRRTLSLLPATVKKH